MARGGNIEIPIAVDAGGVEKQINNGLVKPIENAEEALEKLGKVDAGKDLARELDKAQDATQRLDTELDQARKGLSKLGFAGKEAGRDVKAGLDEAKDEAKSSGKEAAASFSGGFDDVADFLQETLANAFEGFGPVGAAAGIALAAVLGTVLSNAQEAQEKLNDAREAAVDLSKTMYQNGGTLPMEDAVESLFDLLAKEIRPNGPIQQMIDGFVDFGSRVDAVKKSANDLGLPLRNVAKALSGSDLEESERVLEAVNERLSEMKGNIATGWVWETGPLDDLKTQLEVTIEQARVADEALSVVGSSFESQAYRDKVNEIGQAWQNAATDASDYITEQDGVTTFDWSKYLTDAEATLQAANEYKRKIVTLPDDIRTEAESIFSEQGAVAANSYTDAYIGASAADKQRFVEAAKGNSTAAGKTAGETLAAETEAAAKAKAQGWGTLSMPVRMTVDDSAVRNYTPPTKTVAVRYLPQAV